MEESARDTLVQKLGEAISDLSERCYYAGWLTGTEHVVPELCRRAVQTGRPQVWGHDAIAPGEAESLLALAAQAGSWANLDEAGKGYVPFQPVPVPPEYLAALDREPRVGAPGLPIE